LKTSIRAELREPVCAFVDHLSSGAEAVPLKDLASLFGAEGDLLETVAQRGDIRFVAGKFTNDGPELTVPAARVELEVPNLLRGRYESSVDGFTMTFPSAEFSLRACVKIAIIRKCFELRELRAGRSFLELDFGNSLADRRYEF
jgi:hypothetical protein